MTKKGDGESSNYSSPQSTKGIIKSPTDVHPQRLISQHHSAYFINERWLCCEKVNSTATGCQSGEHKHHPGKVNTDLVRSWSCCGKPRVSEGCKARLHPLTTTPARTKLKGEG